MSIKSILFESAAVVVVLIGGAYLMMRRHGISVELTRHSGTSRKAEAVEAQETLQRLAADPKLTVVWQRSENLGGKRNPIVLCVLKRPIVSILVKPIAPAGAIGRRSLLERLDSVDVEPVPYSKAELPSLIAEIAAVQKNNPSSPFSNDLKELLVALKRKEPPETEVVFY